MDFLKDYFRHNSKRIIKISLIFLALLFFILSLAYVNHLKNEKLKIEDEKILKWNVLGEEIALELASSSNKRYQGLSNRNSLCHNCGMLFVFEEPRNASFVMRDMNFPLDIIFIRDDKVIKIYENLVPEGGTPQEIYSSPEPVNLVLELNAGRASQLNLKEGEVINLPIEF